MNQKILELLAKEAEKKPEDMTDEDILDVLLDSSVETEILEQDEAVCHKRAVSKLGDIFVCVVYTEGVTGDIDFYRWNIEQVKPVQKTITVYEPFG